MKKLIYVIIAIFLLTSGLFIINDIPDIKKDGLDRLDHLQKTDELVQGMLAQMFPGSQYTMQDGLIRFDTLIPANYQTLYLESLHFGRFIEDKNEYLAVFRAPEEVTFHAGGFYYAMAAIFDAATGQLKGQLQHFTADEGDISILEGVDRDHVLFIGSTTYQGWTEASGGLYLAAQETWVKKWPVEDSFWKDRYAVFGSNKLVLYKRVIEPHNQDAVIPPWHFEPEGELLWDPRRETFVEPEI